MTVLVVGSLALDNVRTPFGEVEGALGGSCSYASVSASHFAPTAIVGVVGGDFPAAHLDLFRSRKIDTSGVEVVPDGKTFRWRGYYEYDMSQAHTLETQLNAFATFEPKIPENLREAEFVMLGNIDPELQLEVLRQVRRPRLTLLDTMNYWIEGKRAELMKVIERCDIVLLNDAEARMLCDTVNLQVAARQLLTMGVKRVIIKKGEHGCLMFSANTFFAAPAFPLEVVKDPTGAGDTFAGGFIGYLAAAPRLTEAVYRQAVVVGTAMAGFTVEDFSLRRLSTLTPETISGRCDKLLKHTKFNPVRFKSAD